MEDKHLQFIVLILMICACFFHIIQLILYPFNLKWFVALIGGFSYFFASLGLYKNKKFRYYITLIVPSIGGVIILIIFTIAFLYNTEIFIQFNIFTGLAAIVEIPAVILSIILIKKEYYL